MAYNPRAPANNYGRNPYEQLPDTRSFENQQRGPAPAYTAPYSNGPSSNYEMQRMNGANGGMAGATAGENSASNPQAILDECSRIRDGTTTIEKLLTQLESAHRRALNDTVTDTSSPTIREINTLNADIMAQYKALIDRMKWIKKKPESGSPVNQNQIGLVDRKLKATYQRYLQVENDYQRRMREQMARQYRITRPDATEQEVREACEDPNQQIFSQALLRSDRRGESRQVLSAVRDRHEAIQKIERDMEQLATLFQDMDRMVIEQEPLIEHIEKGAEETHTNIVQGNEHLGTAVVSAKAARKKKWICFWICVLLLIIIAVVVGVVVWWYTAGPGGAHPNNHQ